MKKVIIYIVSSVLVVLVALGAANMAYQKGHSEGYSEGYNDGYSVCAYDAQDVINCAEALGDFNAAFDYIRLIFSIVADEGIKIN